MKLLDKVRAVLAPYSKAIVAAVAPIIVGYALKWGFDVDVSQVNVFLTALISGTGVFAKANR